MTWYEALILGLVQGLTEYLPVSSSGHLAIGSTLFGIDSEVNLSFTIVVHIATVFSTLVILWKEVSWLFKGLFRFKMNDETRYIINIIVSMIPVGIVGVFFKDYVEAIFGSGLLIVGLMLLLTALLLTLCTPPAERKDITQRCLHHRCGTSLRRNAGLIALGVDHRYGTAAGQQERELGTILLPDGHTAHPGRSAARHNKDGKRQRRLYCQRPAGNNTYHRLPCRIHIGVSRMQVDD